MRCETCSGSLVALPILHCPSLSFLGASQALSSIPLLDETYCEVLRPHGVRGDDARDRLDLDRHGVFRHVMDEDATKQQHFATVAVGWNGDAELLVTLELERIGAGDA